MRKRVFPWVRLTTVLADLTPLSMADLTLLMSIYELNVLFLVRIQTETLSKEQQRKLLEAFGSGSTSSFTGTTLFDSESGNLTGDFWQSLDSDEQKAMDDMQKMGKEGIFFLSWFHIKRTVR